MIKKLIVAFVLGTLLSMGLTALRVNPVISYFIVIFFILFIVLYIPLLLPAYVSRNKDRIEKFLLKNKHNAQFYIYYALANKQDDEVKNTITTLVEKENLKNHRPLYETIFHLYHQDYYAAKDSLKEIRPNKLKEYYEIGVELEIGSLHKAEIAINQLKSDWVKFSLLTELEKKKGDRLAAVRYAKMALEKTRGLQWYMLYCEYERELNI